MAATSRLARMVKILQQDPGVSIDELAAHLGVPDAVVRLDMSRAAYMSGDQAPNHVPKGVVGLGGSKA